MFTDWVVLVGSCVIGQRMLTGNQETNIGSSLTWDWTNKELVMGVSGAVGLDQAVCSEYSSVMLRVRMWNIDLWWWWGQWQYVCLVSEFSLWWLSNCLWNVPLSIVNGSGRLVYVSSVCVVWERRVWVELHVIVSWYFLSCSKCVFELPCVLYNYCIFFVCIFFSLFFFFVTLNLILSNFATRVHLQ